MIIKRYIYSLLGIGIETYDDVAAQHILRSIELYHKGGLFNITRAIRLYNRNRKRYGCCIPPRITIGNNLYIAHAHGILIGKTTIIGDNCKIYPNVLLVASIIGDRELREQGEKRWHPKIGNNCLLGAGSIVCGRIEIGDNVIVAAGAIVTKDVPSNSIVKNTNEITARNPNGSFDILDNTYIDIMTGEQTTVASARKENE